MATTAQTPRAAGISMLMHAGLIGLLVLLAWWSKRHEEDQPDIFEMVAGPGDNYAATQAPTADPVETETTVDISIPQPPPPQPRPTPIQPAPEPTVIEKAPEPAPVPPKEEPKPKPVSYRDFVRDREQPVTRQPTAPQPIKVREIDTSRIANAVVSVESVGASGTALSRIEADEMQAYASMIIERIRRSVREAGINDIREVGVEFSVSAGGKISNARITRSSGSQRFDDAVLAAFRAIPILVAPPTGQAEVFRATIRMREG